MAWATATNPYFDAYRQTVRLDAGELGYEYQTDNKALRILGPACGFGADYLRRLRGEGLYAETIDEAIANAQTKNAALTGVWFVKR